MPETAQDPEVRRFGAFEINLQSGELRKNGMRLRFSGQPFQVLAVLIKRAGEAVTREELHAELWSAETFVDFDHGLNNSVARIREALDDSASTPRYVETIPRRGYRFIAPLNGIPPLAVSPPPEQEIKAQPEALDGQTPNASKLITGKGFLAARLKFLIMGAAAIAALAAAFVLYRGAVTRARWQPVRSLAVLPLKNLSGDTSQEYLADGMTEEVIGRLAGIHDLRVISRTSVMAFKQSTLSAPEIARTLRVDALVEGSIMRQGTRIRIHAQLIRAASDEHFWSETYDREIGDVLALQSEVAQDIAEKVNVTVTGQEQTSLNAARHVSPEVYESYLKGQFGPTNSRTEIEDRIAYFKDAIGKDPTFAPAYLGLGIMYQGLSTIFIGASPAELRPKVLRAAEKALELDPDLAEAHALVAHVYQTQWRWSEAESEYKRALQLKPNDAVAHLGFAEWLMCRGRTEEALAWAQRARELDPLGNDGIDDIAGILFSARRYDDAIRELRTESAIHPDSANVRWSLGRALIAKGKPEEAIFELERTALMTHRSPGALEMLATAYAHAGRRAEALAIVDELKQRLQKGYVPAGSFINPYLALRDYNEAFSWFERAYAEQSNILQYLKTLPFFDPVRGDPRFQDLVRRVGL